jgi:phosphoribosylformylglycinamidine synthase
MAALSLIIPGAQAWPKFTRNKSEQFEARLSLVEVQWYMHSASDSDRGQP